MKRLAVGLAAALAALAGITSASAGGAAAECAAPSSLMEIGPPLRRSATHLEQSDSVTIVAVGSSSTLGVGASSPAFSYPNRLRAELAARFPDAAIRVDNRGKGGEDAPEELARLGRDVIADRPDLVIWQVGTNAVLRRDDLAADGERIERGIGQLQQDGADIVLMDMQYAPRVLARPAYAAMERLIADAAKRSRVGLFRRFDIMRLWQTAGPTTGAATVGPDGLHMTDRGYGCLAVELAQAISANWLAQDRARQRRDEPAIAGVRSGP